MDYYYLDDYLSDIKIIEKQLKEKDYIIKFYCYNKDLQNELNKKFTEYVMYQMYKSYFKIDSQDTIDRIHSEIWALKQFDSNWEHGMH